MSLKFKILDYFKGKIFLDYFLIIFSIFLALFCVMSISISELGQNDFFALIVILFTLGVISNSFFQNSLNKKYSQNF